MTAFGFSLILFLIGVLVAEGNFRSRIPAGISASLVFLFVLLNSVFLLSHYMTGEGINEAVVYHLLYVIEGAGLKEYYPTIIAGALLVLGGFLLSLFYFYRLHGSGDLDGSGSRFILANACIVFGILLSPATHALLDYFHSGGDPTYALNYPRTPEPDSADFPLPDLVFSQSEGDGKPLQTDFPNAVLEKRFSGDFLEATGTDTVRLNGSQPEFRDHYRPPVVRKSDGSPRNLLLIYAESLEQTYFDENIFPGLIRGLRDLKGKSTYFSDIRQIVGSGWTVGGMVSGQCGVPLVTPSQGNSMSGMNSFYSGAVCLGDLLHGEGYYLSYLNGASMTFAGKGKFYATHRFDEIRGRDELLPELEDPSYVSPWGLFDDSLFDLSFETFTGLSESGQKFGLFLLTLDTHHPDGHPSGSCQDIRYRDGSNPILNAVACSDHLISRFVERLLRSPYAENTVIVITSDHLAMNNTATDLLNRGERRDLFMIIDPRGEGLAEISKRGTVLDIGPTILDALGLEGDMGLGRSLIGDDPSLAEELENLDGRIHRWKPAIKKFWEFPSIDGGLLVDAGEKWIQIGVTRYDLPVLVELGENLETTPYFEFRSPKKLTEYLLEFGEDRPFLWFDKCHKTRALESSLSGAPYCFVGGKLGGTLAATALDRNLALPEEAFRRIMKGDTDPQLFASRYRDLLGLFAGQDALRMVQNSPENSTVFVPPSETDRYAMEFFGLHDRNATNRVPVDGEFYFLPSQLNRNQYAPFFDFRSADGDDGTVMRAIPKTRLPKKPNRFKVRRIAHGGGAVAGKSYTNSIDALNQNLQRGYGYFEIDLSFTSDGELVCIHDWGDSFKRSFGIEATEIPTLKTFIELVRDRSEFEKCTLASLAQWMGENPSAKLVTDVKGGDNITALARIRESIPDSSARVIPQVYNPKNMKTVRDMGFSQTIWTLYRYGGDADMVLRWTDFFDGSFAVTMPGERADAFLPSELKRRGVPTYVHTINDPEVMARYFKAGVSEIYTDSLAPDDEVSAAVEDGEDNWKWRIENRE